MIPVRPIPVIAALAAAFFVGAADAQQTGQLTLPGVTVTAPPFVPLYLRPGNGLKAFQRNPYFGNNRVEEDKFTPVACDDDIARVAPVSTGSCREGYHLVPAYLHGTDRHWRNTCQIDHDVTIYDAGGLSVEADVLSLTPIRLRPAGRLGAIAMLPVIAAMTRKTFRT